jgi:transposase
MAKGYRPVDRDQGFLMPPDMREWLAVSDPVWLVIEIIEKHLDTSAFHAGRRRGGAGREGYDPDMLVTLLVWGWMQQVRSSRRIERLCSRDVSFRVICAGDVPDHVTIARFRQGFGEAVVQLFAEVLVLCARLGLGQVGVVAVDGTKIAAQASPDANRTEEGLRRAAEAEREAARRAAEAAAAAHAETDAAEDAEFGEGRGDEMDDDPGPGSARSARIAEAMADLKAERETAEREQEKKQAERQQRAGEAAGPLPGRPPAGSEVVLAEQALTEARAVVAQRRQQWQATGEGRDPCPGGVDSHHWVRRSAARLERARHTVARREARQSARPEPRPVRNMTDPQSRLQPVRGGSWVQGYNAQAAASADGIILATSVSNSSSDSTAFIGLLRAASLAAERMGTGPIGLVLADAGYLSVDNLTEPGPDRLIAVGKRRDLEHAARGGDPPDDSESRPAGGDEQIAAMRARLATPEGITAYRQRGRIIETVFGHQKHNWRFTRFTGAGQERAQSDWAFHGAVHNLAKIINQIAAEPGWQTSS